MAETRKQLHKVGRQSKALCRKIGTPGARRQENCQRLYNELEKCMRQHPQDFEDELKKALKNGYPLDYRNHHGETLLYRFVSGYRSMDPDDVPAILLEQGADPNIANNHNYPLLGLAIIKCQSPELIERILKFGADVNARGCWGLTAFYCAAHRFIYSVDEAGRAYGLDAARVLLDHGADPYLNRDWLKDYANDNEQERRRREQFKEWTDCCIRQREATELAAKEDDESFMR